VLEAEYQSLPFGDGLAQTGNVSDPTENHFTGKERDAQLQTRPTKSISVSILPPLD
jgi:hypothetical protein